MVGDDLGSFPLLRAGNTGAVKMNRNNGPKFNSKKKRADDALQRFQPLSSGPPRTTGWPGNEPMSKGRLILRAAMKSPALTLDKELAG